MAENSKIVKEWFARWLADFKIYSPLYKIEVSAKDELFADYNASATVGNCAIHVGGIVVVGDEVVNHDSPFMYRGKGAGEDALQKDGLLKEGDD